MDTLQDSDPTTAELRYWCAARKPVLDAWGSYWLTNPLTATQSYSTSLLLCETPRLFIAGWHWHTGSANSKDSLWMYEMEAGEHAPVIKCLSSGYRILGLTGLWMLVVKKSFFCCSQDKQLFKKSSEITQIALPVIMFSYFMSSWVICQIPKVKLRWIMLTKKIMLVGHDFTRWISIYFSISLQSLIICSVQSSCV